jgi:hypothetical protein
MTGGSEHHKEAIAALADREYSRSGDEYTRAAWRRLADPRDDLGPFDSDEKGWVGRGVQSLVTAALAYRVAGDTARATRRAVAGVAIARDLATVTDHPAQRACFTEFVGDLRAAAGLDGVTDAYQSAEQAYREAGDSIDSPQTWGTTPLFEAASGTIKQLARGPANGEIAVKWEDLHGADPDAPGEFLAARGVYKRQRFASLVETAVSDGYLAAPRGTTEYGNSNHRCPQCGSNDVNWAGGNVLCMRCSTPQSGGKCLPTAAIATSRLYV